MILKPEDGNVRYLFKQGRPGTRENWAEKVTSELASLLGFPHAVYHLPFSIFISARCLCYF